MIWTLLALLEIAWLAGIAIWIILERRSPAATMAWILGLALLPGLGALVYLLAGPRRWRRKGRRLGRVREGLAPDRQAAPGRASESVTVGMPEDRAALFAQGVALGAGAPVRVPEPTIFCEGDTAYAAIEDAIRGARRHVHLEYFIYKSDGIGTRLRDRLVERASAGVEVRLLLDSIGSALLTREFLRPLRKAGAQVAWFNRVRLMRLRPRLLNFRTHRKIVVVDDAVAFTGGMNVDDVHVRAPDGTPGWRDTHVRIRGRAVRDLELTFLENWHFATRSDPRLPEASVDTEPCLSGPVVQVVPSGPDRDVRPLPLMLVSALGGARRRIELTTPYLVPDEPILATLKAAAYRGVEVRVLVPVEGDSPLTAAASRSYFEELIRAGVKIHQYRPRMIHAKTLVIDDDLAFVGTANMDNRSFRLNFEVVLLVWGRETARLLSEQFAADLAESHEVGLPECVGRPFYPRLFEATARLLWPFL